jgi:SNF2 family DNA or RNA helicase
MMGRESLYGVQKKALELSSGKPGFAWFMEMGLGKTRTTYQEIYEMFEGDEIDVAIIFCPKTLRPSWEDEAKEIEFPYPVLLHSGDANAMKKKMDEAGTKVVVVIHFEMVLGKGGDLIELLKEKEKRFYVAIDESTRIKNPKAKVGKYLIQIRDWFKYRRVLSGAPNPQGPHDLWGQLMFIDAVTQTFHQFKHTYCTMGGYMNKKITGAQNIDILEMRTKDYVFRAKKLDWTDLPEKLPPTTRLIEMAPRQAMAYKTMLYDFVTEWGEVEVTAKMAITAKNKLQQIGSGFMYDNDGNVVRLFEGNEKNPKVEELISIVDEIETKVIIFYYFKPTKNILAERMEKEGINFVVVESGLNDAQYTELKAQFNGDDKVKVALCQINAVKYGWTLLGNQETMPCHNTVFFENSYDLEARVQGEDRNHRHGQRNSVSYTDIAISGEDKKVLKALQRKGDLQEAILSEFTYVPEN